MIPSSTHIDRETFKVKTHVKDNWPWWELKWQMWSSQFTAGVPWVMTTHSVQPRKWGQAQCSPLPTQSPKLRDVWGRPQGQTSINKLSFESGFSVFKFNACCCYKLKENFCQLCLAIVANTILSCAGMCTILNTGFVNNFVSTF